MVQSSASAASSAERASEPSLAQSLAAETFLPPAGAPSPHLPRQRTDATFLGPTVAMPTVARSRRTRWLRAWMVAVPADALAPLGALLLTTDHWKGVLAFAALTVASFFSGGLYRARRHVSFLDEVPSLCYRLLAAAAVVAIVAALRHDSVTYVGSLLQVVALSSVLVLVGRATTRALVRFARRRRWVEQGAIVVGAGPVAIELGRLLRRYPQYGLRFVGFVDVDPLRGIAATLPVIGTLDQLPDVMEATGAAVVIIADIECPEAKLLEIARLPVVIAADLWVVPRMRELQSQGGIPDHIGAVPVVQIQHTALTGRAWIVKRTFDIVFATVALILVSPVLLACALAVFLEGGRGIFFRQQRIGRHGRPFDLFKFRSMRPVDDNESQTNWSIANDRRVGPVGRFLRRTSLDELPQLWNILRGDMTVVGPRPERPYFVDRFSADDPSYAMRHRAPVGLTGLAQVSGLRGDTPISDRARFDNYYIENWSLWLDIKVLIRTCTEVLRGGGR
jgi:exopolysaccharide biosynthesis polyprenyl glycosylphosphotransferase